MASNLSSNGNAASPPRATSAVPQPQSMPVGLNAAQQAQFVRQQQLRQQQQQQMLAMQGMQGGGGMMGMPNPQIIQQQMFQLSAMLQNPQLPPPMRMNLQGQMQQCQMMMMQYQQRMAMNMHQQQQQFRAGGGGMSPQMVHGTGGMVNGAGTGQKRQREDGTSEQGSPDAKKTELA